ncbi:protein tyrosine/serine phosphatase [Psychromicrobium silvestre]|uniref:Protein tyrosine/serine phosphatase n=1 Tax=Psychromicrobium silvestre TaxID=1645614 RepID=A0A7Y9S814_9MICC|nr:tyrosine-protein phosphatase [Psychromicrobium silvestre]NYE95526.1 protein tyrosine/serine phosphatase [Psychromicrobium silvestre]
MIELPREVDWEGAFNARDLGGLGEVLPGRVFRMARRESLSQAGWQQMHDAGVRTIIDLRNADEAGRRSNDPTVSELFSIKVHLLPVEDQSDPQFQTVFPILNSPESIWPMMRIWPDKLVAVYRAIARAEGAVVIHCAGGRDRTGMIVMGLLQLAEVPAELIADDYETGVRVSAPSDPKFDGVQPGESNPVLDDWAKRTRQAMLTAAAEADVEGYLLEFGVQAQEIGAIRSLLLGP